ncbi:MAG: hypothetical protein DMG96_09815 [Acidobacteria bacterium]|nr:MAG: hypothetical protein DMG96_09815 [Acidobacteriota bacterium]
MLILTRAALLFFRGSKPSFFVVLFSSVLVASPNLYQFQGLLAQQRVQKLIPRDKIGTCLPQNWYSRITGYQLLSRKFLFLGDTFVSYAVAPSAG